MSELLWGAVIVGLVALFWGGVVAVVFGVVTAGVILALCLLPGFIIGVVEGWKKQRSAENSNPSPGEDRSG